ncbi:GerMN domain-containing protein [Bacillaceae bacterium CLA-AA-H227]|uniref:GerMN domain-containing protein n=1 Tax=Robertmurraya yapensis (ex Hitch et al 2024) TaxID=3133160 RepID=A0ACC6SDT2_9BACI
MKRSEWSDEQLEDLLSNMPKIQDHRDPRDIYQNITITMNKKKQRSWVVPSVATAAAVLLFVILAPNLMNWNDSTSNSMQESSTAQDAAEQPQMEKMTENSEDSAGGKEEEAKIFTDNENEEKMQMTSIEEEESYTALYEEDITEENVFTYAIPDEQGQNIVPVSIVVPKEDGKELFEQYKEIMTGLKEEEWGLSEFYPLNAELSISNKSILNVNVPTDHSYRDGSINAPALIQVLQDTAKTFGIKEVSLFTENKEGIDLGNLGTEKMLDLSDDSNHAYYFYNSQAKPEQLYLVPFNQSYKNIEEAFTAMKENITTHGLAASIPQDINIEEIKSAGEDILNLKFDEDSKIANEPSFIHTIEAILLTAKDFDFEKVIIQYNKLDKIGKFNMNEEIDVPVAPNKMEILN